MSVVSTDHTHLTMQKAHSVQIVSTDHTHLTVQKAHCVQIVSHGVHLNLAACRADHF